MNHHTFLLLISLLPFLGVARVDAQACTQLSGTYATVQSGTTSGSSNQSGTCGGTGAADAQFVFVAPRAGTYTIDTIGSEFDTVLYARDGSANELACNDDIQAATNTRSRLALALADGQSVIIVVDGFEAQQGAFTLRINADCPLPFRNDPRDLGNPLAVSVSGTTSCAANRSGGASCGGAGAGGNGGTAAADATFLYAAPSDGDYTISTASSNFDTVLYVRIGTCAGAELSCNDDITPGTVPQSRLTLPLTTGQTIAITVDGYADAKGDYVLSIVGAPHTPTITKTPTQTRTATPTPSVTLTRTITATPTRTLTASPSASQSPTRTATVTRTRTITTTRTFTQTPTPTRTGSATRTIASTATTTAEPQESPSPTPSLPATESPTATTTATVTATRSTTATRSPTVAISGPGCCQIFLSVPVCEAPVSPAGCAANGGTLILNASCVRGVCVSNEPTPSATPSETLTAIDTPTPTTTRTPSTTPTLRPTGSPTATTARVLVMLPVASGDAGSRVVVNGRVARGASGARLFWRVGDELQPLAQVRAGADGNFEGEITVPSDAAIGSAQVCAVAAGTAARGADLACAPFTVLPSELGSISGEVIDANDAAIATADVFLGDERDTPLARTTTDLAGRYSFANLAAGSYVVHVVNAGSFVPNSSIEVSAGQPFNVLHRATTPPATAVVYRCGTLALLAEPAYQRDATSSYWLARFGSLPGGSDLFVRFFVNVAFVQSEPGALAFTFLSAGEPVHRDVARTPGVVAESLSDALADAYFVDVSVGELPPGDITMRISRVDIESENDLEVLHDFHVDMIDLGRRWLNGRVAEPTIDITAAGTGLAYRFGGLLPHPDLSFDFNQSIDLGANTPPLSNHVSLQATIEETYYTDDSWSGRIVAADTTTILGTDLSTSGAGFVVNGPDGANFVDTTYEVDLPFAAASGTCSAFPAASQPRNFSFNPCTSGCAFAAPLRAAVASCPQMAKRIRTEVASDLTLTATIGARNNRSSPTRIALDPPLCRGFLEASAERSLTVDVAYDADAGVCPAECASFTNLCIDLDAQAQVGIRCLTRSADSADVVLAGAHAGCGPSTQATAGRGANLALDFAKDLASDGAGHALLLWVDDSGVPAVLFSSYFDGETWSTPVSIAEGFLDSPQATFLDDGRAIAVWEQSHLSPAAASTADTAQLLSSSELYSAQWNGTNWSSALAITQDEVADARPSLAAARSQSTAMVVWTRGNGGLGQPPLVVAYAQFNGSTWSAPSRIAADSIALDYAPTLAFDNLGRAAVVFSRDADRNLTTLIDRSLMFASFNGSSWSIPELIGSGFTPSLSFGAANDPLVALVRPAADAGPALTATGEGNRSQLVVARRRQGNWSFTAIGARVFAERPQVQVGADNHALVIFRQFDAPTSDGPSTVLSAAGLDLSDANAKWTTTPVALHSTWQHSFDFDRNSSRVFVAATRLDSLPAAPGAQLLADDNIEVTVLPAAEQLTLRRVIPSDVHPLVGDSIEIDVEIANVGLAATMASADVAVSNHGSEVGTLVIPANLGIGSSVAATLPLTISQAGEQRLSFAVGEVTIGEFSFGTPPPPWQAGGFVAPQSGRPELSWQAPSDGIRSYRIYRDSGDGQFRDLVGTTAGLRFTDATAALGQTQRYAIFSVDEVGLMSAEFSVVVVTVPGALCGGDCNRDGMVTIDELVTATAITRGERPASDCRNVSSNGATATVDDTISAVDSALGGCP